jgi:hypothetical protein
MIAGSADAFADSTGRQMTDPRPAPQYGEYATPEQQAAAMGKVYVPPTPPPAADSRVDISAPQKDAVPQHLQSGAHLVDRFVAIFQLGIGLVLLVNSDYFHVAEMFNTALAQFGLSNRISTSVDAYGGVFLALNIVFLLSTMAITYLRLRRAKTAFWVPFAGYAAFGIVIGISLYIANHR